MSSKDLGDEDELKTITFDLNTDNPRCVVLKIECEFDLNGSDIYDALKELTRIIKNAHKHNTSGH